MNTPKPMPPIEVLRAMFELDAERGVLIRKRTWTNHKAGEVCGTPMKSGHLQTHVEGKRYLVHRIVYFMATGTDPLHMRVDHINGNPADNRPSNLRLASHSENGRHRVKLHGSNSTGYRNVSWNKTWQCWAVSITVAGKRIQKHVRDFSDAVRMAQDLRRQHFGEFCGTTL